MGASVGVFLDQMNPELRDAITHSEKQKYTIAEYDAAMLDREMSKVFKKHGKIIKTLTSRTKAQLKRTIEIKNKAPEDIYKIVGGNNNYAMFMKQLHMNKQEIEMENLKNSSKTELYDEEQLVNIIGTSTNKELKLFCEAYAREKSMSLKDTFIAKTKPDSQLQKFVSMCFNFDRDESKTVNEGLAAQQAQDIHKAGAARLLGCDEELIYKILVTSSRAQCAAIADQYLMQFHIKFERAINMKFKGNCSKLMLLWALPIPVSIITCIHSYEERMIIDKVAIISMVSKYDKDILAQVDIAAEKTFEKNLIGIVQRGLSGNLLNAVTGWIENASPDKGYERVTELFIENQQGFGRTLEELLKSAEFQTRLLFLVKKEQEELDKFMKDNRIKFNPEDKLDLRSLGSIGTMDSFDAYHSTDAHKDTKAVINKYSAKAPEDRATAEYDAKYKALQDYLKSFFSSYDKKNTGFFTETEFWELMKKLPLSEMGLTEAEVDAMMQWSEWVSDEKVVYHEAIFELADSILTAIEAKTEGETDVLLVVAEISKAAKLGKGHSEAKVARHDSVETISEVPDYFLQYIYDTFYAYDFDNNGYLCKTELDSVLPVLNINMTFKDFINEEHDRILHKDAVQIIAKKIRMWFLDQENDNYICLVDKDSGLFFWFNCRDESSQWADNEGEGWAGYGSRRASAVAPEAGYTNSLRNAALGGESDHESQSAQKSPRAPTAAEEKEMDAKTSPRAAAEEKEAAATAAASEPKTRGIAEADDDADTADLTPIDSAKQDDDRGEAKAEAKEAAATTLPPPSPRAASPRAASQKVPAPASPRPAPGSPRADAGAKAEPSVEAKADVAEAPEKPASPRPAVAENTAETAAEVAAAPSAEAPAE